MQVERAQPVLPGFEDESEGWSLGPESALLFESPAEIFRRVFRAVRPRTALPSLTVEFRRFANANSFIQLDAGELKIRISDALESAPAPVLEALGFILICKLYRKPVPAERRDCYNLYLNRQDVRRNLHLLRQSRGRKHLSGPAGKHYQLDEVFAAVNTRFFNGMMAQPSLGWSRRVSRTILGHFDPSHNAIILSRLLDRADVPRLAVEFVMYHEMLHIRFPIEAKGTRRRFHPKAFRDAEKQFPEYKEAKAMLDRLCGSARRSENW